ncbi:menaquinone biosynthesis decarboxylase [bacterium]|nr:menaquinone biosynthesis decarboxylase [bacterium]MBU2462015.1 menaquinone biosynthesis decarboxylase [bacterium]
MAYRDLRGFIKILEESNLLRRVKEPVDCELEITEISDRVVKKGGPALLFENVKGYNFPVLINAFGSKQRIELALGNIQQIAERIIELLTFEPPKGLLEKVLLLPKLLQMSQFIPKRVKNGPCQEVIVKEPNILKFPILKCWPGDGGKFITLPMVFTADPETGRRNVGMYRMQVYDDTTCGMHWHIHKGGARHYRRYCELNKRMAIAVALGGDPATIYASTAPLPDGIDEMLFAGFLRKEPVELVQCKTIDLEVPAHSEIVLEGYVEPGELREEGPFGDHTGFYSPKDLYPVFHITCITHRKDAIYPATVVGKPPMEDCFLGKATERIFLPLLKFQLPEITDINLPIEGVFHNCAIISIKKEYPGQAKKVIHSLWGMGQMMFTKMLIIVDSDIDLQNLSEVAWKVFNNIDPKNDIVFSEGPLDVLDHASNTPYYGTKVGIDATRKDKGEGRTRAWPDEIQMSDEIQRLVDEKWDSYEIAQ